MDNERKRHSHEYQDLFNNIPGGAFLCGQDGHCIMTEVNRGFLELTGFGREELEEQFGCSFEMCIRDRNKTVPETGGWEKTMKIDLGQVQARDAEILEAAEESCTVLLGAGGGGITPVSYTHLDVYKRQIWSCRLTAESAVFFSGTACRLFYDILIRIS